MYGPGWFLANTDIQFGTTNNKQTIHMVCLPTTTIVNYNPTPPRHHPLPTAIKAHLYSPWKGAWEEIMNILLLVLTN